MGDVEDEVRRLIFLTFNDLENEWISSEKIIRFWSLDFQWVDSHDAQKLLESLVKTGWLEIDGDKVKPVESLPFFEIPIGWAPMVRKMIEGINFLPYGKINSKHEESEIIIEINDSDAELTVDFDETSSQNNRSVDPMIQKITEIRIHLSNASGLEVREIQRRAQRKRKACMPMTLWMALLLVGREQRIDISSFL